MSIEKQLKVGFVVCVLVSGLLAGTGIGLCYNVVCTLIR
jgi:hypothetical protein